MGVVQAVATDVIMVAAYRVTITTLEGNSETFQDVYAGKAWRAALTSLGFKVRSNVPILFCVGWGGICSWFCIPWW